MDHATSNHQNRWQEVRLFISSTFRDMQAERDYLIRHVFPKVREELLKRRLYFVDIDLRWGLTSEDDIVGACRSIIDECRPLFLGILGGRYGWVPKNTPQSVSITEDEIEHAIRNFESSGYEGVYFLFRDDTSTLSIPETHRREYLEKEGSESACKLKRLRDRICSSGLRHDYYNAEWNPDANRFTDLLAFGNKVYDYIMDFVGKSFGPVDRDTSLNDEEDSIEEIFINQHCRFFIDAGLEPVFESMKSAMQNRRENNVVLFTGPSGTGKSAFLCKLIQSMKSEGLFRVFHHFIGVTPHSASLAGTLRRLCRILAASCGSREPLPHELDKLVIHFQNLIVRIPPEIPTVIIIDGLNQLLDENNAHELLWLPPFIPSNITLILSSTPHPLTEAIAKRWADHRKIELTGLREDASYQLVNHYLSRYQKRLTQQQIELLLAKTDSRIPLYLSTVIEELRIYGDYEGLNVFVKSLPGNIESLLEWILTSRLMHSAEFTDGSGRAVSETFVPRYLSFLYLSQSGLSEAELSQLLEPDGGMGNTAAITRQLRTFLVLHGELLNFYHDSFRKAVFNAFIRDTGLNGLHEQLAQFFRKKADPSGDAHWHCEEARPYSQLLYHTLQLESPKALDELVLSGFFEKYAKLTATEIILREIKNAVQTLSDDPGDEHWTAVVRCARVFARVSGVSSRTGYNKAHPLESAIAEGRDEDVETLLKSSSIGVEASILRMAAKTLFASTGRNHKAEALDVDTSASVLKDPGHSKETHLLFSALNKPDAEAENKPDEDPSLDSAPETEIKSDPLNESDPETDIAGDPPGKATSIPSRRHIPVWQVFALMFTGRYKKIMGVLGFIAIAALIIFVMINLRIFVLVDAIEHWKISFVLIRKIAETAIYLVIGLISLLPPYLLVKAIHKKLMNLLEKKSDPCMLSMVAAIPGMRPGKKLHAYIRITQYAWKLRQSDITESYCNDARIRRVLTAEINNMLKMKKTKQAGLAAACLLNLDCDVQEALVRELRGLPDDVLYKVLQSMLSYERIFFDPTDALNFVLSVYGWTPPVPILMKAVRLQLEKDEYAVAAILSRVDKPVLARCLLRFLPSIRKPKSLRLFERIKSFMGREFFSVPVILNVRDLLEKIPLIVLFIPVAFVTTGTAAVLLGFVPYLIFLALPYPLYRLCKYWDRHEEMARNVDSYPLSFFEDELGKWFSWKEPGIRAGVSMIETAAVDALLDGKENPEVFVSDFPTGTVLRVWRALLVPGRVKNRGKLLLPLMESEALLQKALVRIPSGKSDHGKPIDEKARRKQQKRVKPNSSKPASAIAMVLTTALIAAITMGILGLFWDKWLYLLLLKRGWMILAVSVFAGFLPFPKIRYLVTVLFPILPMMLFNSFKLTPYVAGEAIIYPLLPTYAVFLANEAVKLWRGVRLVYPVRTALTMSRLKAAAASLAGGVLIGAAIIMAIYSMEYVRKGDDKPAASEIIVLKDYADAMRWTDSHKALYRKPLKYIVDYPLDFDPNNYYQSNIYELSYRAQTLRYLAYELNKRGYMQECINCQIKLLDYYGWFYTEPRYVDGSEKTFFFDGAGRRVNAAPVITEIAKGSQAEKLGLTEGDVIESINGIPAAYPEDLAAGLAGSRNGSKIAVLTIRRMETRLQVTAPTGDLGAQIWYINAEYLRK